MAAPAATNQSYPSLLLLIPAYNEEKRIEPVLRMYARHFGPGGHYPGAFQLCVVLNGCRDDTLGVVQRVAREFPCVTWLNFPGAIGKGGALIEGLKLTSGAEAIGFIDADGATEPPAFQDLVTELVRSGADCVIASRWLPGSVLPAKQPLKRRLASRTFNAIVTALFWLGIRDTQCGAKVMRCDAARLVHPQLTVSDMAFDVNLLVALKRAGRRIVEIPTTWTDQAGSTVVLGRGSTAMFLSVVRLRLIYSPLYRYLRPLRGLETWLYVKLRAPLPRRRENDAEAAVVPAAEAAPRSSKAP